MAHRQGPTATASQSGPDLIAGTQSAWALDLIFMSIRVHACMYVCVCVHVFVCRQKPLLILGSMISQVLLTLSFIF